MLHEAPRRVQVVDDGLGLHGGLVYMEGQECRGEEKTAGSPQISGGQVTGNRQACGLRLSTADRNTSVGSGVER